MNVRGLQLFIFLILFNLSNQFTIRTGKACEGHPIKIHCPPEEMVLILNADYGRWDANACPYFEDPNMRTNCHSTLAEKVVGKLCNGRQYCHVKAENSVFTDPCPGQVKHAEVHYMCVPNTIFNIRR